MRERYDTHFRVVDPPILSEECPAIGLIRQHPKSIQSIDLTFPAWRTQSSSILDPTAVLNPYHPPPPPQALDSCTLNLPPPTSASADSLWTLLNLVMITTPPDRAFMGHVTLAARQCPHAQVHDESSPYRLFNTHQPLGSRMFGCLVSGRCSGRENW